MFEILSDRLQQTFKRLKGHGKVSEAHLDEAMKELRLALLEADVNFKVVKQFTSKVKERALGAEVMKSLTPAQQIIKVVREELEALMGGQAAPLSLSPSPPTVMMLVGLQGAGKTTTCAKLAAHYKKQGKRTSVIAADMQRPAAVEQLKQLGSDWDFEVYSGSEDPVTIAKNGLEHAKSHGHAVVIIDTAGRLHIDDELMSELENMRALKPHHVLLVVDAMTGQESVNLAVAFDERVGLDGVILTKMDGDARGGAALSIAQVTGKPIRYVSAGEKPDSLDIFHPDRMAQRILGMGDVLTLIERAEDTLEKDKMEEQAKKMLSADFDLSDFLTQMEQVKKLGPLSSILEMLPGMPAGAAKKMKVDDNAIDRMEAIVLSMTPHERREPRILNGSRKARIAAGSGTTIHDLNQLIKNFNQSKKMMKQMSGKQMKRMLGGKGLFNGGLGE